MRYKVREGEFEIEIQGTKRQVLFFLNLMNNTKKKRFFHFGSKVNE